MHFYNLIKKLAHNKDIALFIDMDGVIASYDFGYPLDFKNKRPLISNIATIKEVSILDNVDVFILSVCRKDFQIDEKNQWLDQYASFFKKENRYIISKEKNKNISSAELKVEFLKNYSRDKQIVLVDDDNFILKTVKNELNDIILLQDSELID